MMSRLTGRHPASREPVRILAVHLTGDDGQPSGYLHLKDVMDLTSGDRFIQPAPSKRLRRLASVSCDSELKDARALMRRLGAHVATAFNVDGAVTGVRFLEDIIEELVGQVEDATSI